VSVTLFPEHIVAEEGVTVTVKLGATVTVTFPVPTQPDCVPVTV
jgi:hypothetical protein